MYITQPKRNFRFKQRTTERLFYQNFILSIYRIQRTLGFAPFIMNRGEISCDWNLGSVLYTVSTYVILLTFTVMTQYQIIGEIKTKNVSFNASLVGYLKLLSITQQLLGPLPFLLERRNFQRFLKKWPVFQEEYQKLTGDVLRLNDANTLKNIGMLFIPFAAILPFFIHPMNINVSSIIHDITFSIFFVHEICIILYWLLTSKAIQLIAGQYKSKFTKEVQNGYGYTSVVEAYRLLWMNLCSITNKFAASIGATITVRLVFHVLYMILAAYRTISAIPEHLKNGETSSIIPIVVDLIFHLALIFFYCNVGQNVPKYVTNDMLNTVLNIKEHSQFRSYDEARLNIFLYTINEYSPIVSVCGFYEINRSLFGGVVSVLLTYMIVIIQLKDSI